MVRGSRFWVTFLERLAEVEDIAVGDLMIAEVLQGCITDQQFDATLRLLMQFWVEPISDQELAIEASRNYRRLRAVGFTVRKTVDTLIATRCIRNRYSLLHNDRDFDGFERHLGLRVVRPPAAS